MLFYRTASCSSADVEGFVWEPPLHQCFRFARTVSCFHWCSLLMFALVWILKAWLVVSNINFIFHFIYEYIYIYICAGCHFSHWRTPSFFKMVESPPTSSPVRCFYTKPGRASPELLRPTAILIRTCLKLMIPSGQRLHNYGKIHPFLRGKATIFDDSSTWSFWITVYYDGAAEEVLTDGVRKSAMAQLSSGTVEHRTPQNQLERHEENCLELTLW